MPDPVAMTPATVPSSPGGATTPAAAAPTDHLTFRDVLSDLNPLQYLPVVGTIYRAVTGDTIPEGLRMVGSMVVSGLIGGPVGLLTNIATTIAEKVTGIDPEKIAHSVLADLGLAQPAHAAAAAAAPAPTTPTTAAPAPPAPVPGWTRADLMAEGMTFAADDSPALHGVSGADALNEVELGRLRTAMAAYARTAALAT